MTPDSTRVSRRHCVVPSCLWVRRGAALPCCNSAVFVSLLP
jgi:hypothetical protein